MTVEELAERMRLVMAAIERVYGLNSGVAVEMKSAVVIAATLSLAKEKDE